MAGIFKDLKRCGLMCWEVEINEICDPQKYSPQVATTRHCSLEETQTLAATKLQRSQKWAEDLSFFLQDKTT